MFVASIIRGFIGGAVGTIAMQGYWKLVQKITGDDPRTRKRAGHHKLDDMSVITMDKPDDEGSTATVGRVIYEEATHHEPDPQTKQALSKAVHWTYGILQGGLYGALSSVRRSNKLLGGALWGAGMWLFGDELAVPALGLAPGATAYKPSQHVHRLGAHLVYGVSVAGVTRALGMRRH